MSLPPSRRSPDALRDVVALSLVEGVGARGFQHHVAGKRSEAQRWDGVFDWGAATEALDAKVEPALADVARAEAATALGRAAERGIAAIVIGDSAYPPPLLDLRDPPPVLWALGDLATLEAPACVAIVGTRRATSYGDRAARAVASSLATAGACIVSGMAAGIDTAAHRAALDAGGRTCAVLGTGVDVAYPRGNRALHGEIVERGLVLSELPPGESAGPASFPRRNRIIAALARLTIVVEAGFRSGACITANEAEQLHRDVAAVPGPIDQPQSQGSNLLLRDGGAQFIASPDDAIVLAGLAPLLHAQAAAPTDPAERAVWDALARGERTLEELCASTALPTSACMAAITTLELRGAVWTTITGAVARRAG